MDITMLPVADFIAEHRQLITAILWIAAGVILILFIMRRRKRKLQR